MFGRKKNKTKSDNGKPSMDAIGPAVLESELEPCEGPLDDSSEVATDLEAVTEEAATDSVDDSGVAEKETGKESIRDKLSQKEIEYLKDKIHRNAIADLDLSDMGTMPDEDLRTEIRRLAENQLSQSAEFLTRDQQHELIDDVINETFGLGPLENLFRDDSVTDVMINGSKQVYVERKGRMELSDCKFNNDAHVIRIVQRIVGAVGRRIDETSPMVDGRLEDGSRINAIIPPLAIDGPLVSIRRFGKKPLQASNLLNNGSITEEMVCFLKNVVKGRMNVLISGGTGSGKTTLLNVLSRSINDFERVATIEDAAELQLQQSHVIRMETRPANVEGKGEITTRDLVKNALRMRPDRILIGECRGPEALDMLQAMNTGHDGSLTTVHANTPRDALMRLEMMVGMVGVDIPIWTIRRQIASAINIVVQAVRLTGGVRKVTAISEITGMEGDVISMHDIFRFVQTGLDENGVAVGYFESTGVRPHCIDRLETCGLTMDSGMFERQQLKTVDVN
ncbi:CpaF family protein [Pirellulaceae bacterium]|nr:CpaF family protein [Pirellulaceae bacterium]